MKKIIFLMLSILSPNIAHASKILSYQEAKDGCLKLNGYWDIVEDGSPICSIKLERPIDDMKAIVMAFRIIPGEGIKPDIFIGVTVNGDSLPIPEQMYTSVFMKNFSLK